MATLDPLRSKRVPRFAEEYAKDRNGTQAAIRAGYTSNPDSAGTVAARLLADVRVQELVQQAIERASREASVTAADVLRGWLDIATADPSKIVKVRHLNCRHCWGVGFAYRWRDEREWAEACARAMSGKEPTMPPDNLGGYGFRRTDEPNADCPHCEGEGIEDVRIADVESLTGPERALYAGIKMTRNGPEVVMHDQDAARLNLAKHLGMLVEKRELTGKDGKPLLPTAPPVDLPTDPKALADLYQKLMGG